MNKLISMVVVGIFASLLLVPVVGWAQEAEDATTQSTQGGTKPDDALRQARERAEEQRKSRESRVAEIKEEVAARKLEIKQDVCENRRERINKRIPEIAEAAVRLKGVIDRRYDRVTEFYQDRTLNVEDYDALVAAVELAKAEAEAAVATLEEYEFEVDCTSDTAANQLDSFREATSSAKEALKSYRTALVDLINSIKGASAQSTETTDNTSESTSN